MFLFTFLFLIFSVFLQGYAEGSHYNEHEDLSSPFISSGVAGMFYFGFLLLPLKVYRVVDFPTTQNHLIGKPDGTIAEQHQATEK